MLLEFSLATWLKSACLSILMKFDVVLCVEFLLLYVEGVTLVEIMEVNKSKNASWASSKTTDFMWSLLIMFLLDVLHLLCTICKYMVPWTGIKWRTSLLSEACAFLFWTASRKLQLGSYFVDLILLDFHGYSFQPWLCIIIAMFFIFSPHQDRTFIMWIICGEWCYNSGQQCGASLIPSKVAYQNFTT